MKILKATPELIAKLPLWAQHHIAHLHGEVESRDKVLEETRSGQSKNDFSYTNLHDFGAKNAGRTPRHYLPEYSSLSVFANEDRLSSPGVLDLSVHDRRAPDRSIQKVLYVSAPRGMIEVHPSCANGVYVISRDW